MVGRIEKLSIPYRFENSHLAFFLGLFFFSFREREREEGKERETDLSFYLFVHSLVASCMCPDWRSHLQP